MARRSVVEVEIERVVAGGLGLGHEDDGRVILAAGALPGDRVAVELDRSRKRFGQGHVVDVLVPAPERIEPPCPEVAAGCGGCDLQMAPPPLQRELKVGIVADSLAHIAKIQDLPITAGEQLPTEGYRTTLRCAVVDGRAGFRRRRSNDVHVVESCWIAHPGVREVVEQGRFPGASEVVIRAGARTGERVVVVSPTVGAAVAPAGVRLVGADELAEGSDVHFHELVARRRFRVSASSFFQARPDGAEALVRAAGRAIAPFDPATDRLVDLYGGVGLFTLGLGAQRSVLVERSASSCADARVNLASLGSVVDEVAVERWHATAADVVVADPARAGLGAEGVAQVVATGASRVALVSCDPAALARDVRLLIDAGYRALGVELVDMFPHTHHVEAVTTLVKGEPS
ncbi:MAG: TRAM domain-containing protein [Actinomycetota bacterium]|nr:TRAM domain-containing protein [Actinomycetota bacterium]